MSAPVPFLWFKNDLEEAVTLYTSIFKDSKRESSTPLASEASSVHEINFSLAGLHLMAMNGRPDSISFTPSVSLFVNCASHEELDTLWTALSEQAHILMDIGNYGFSEKFAWLNDKHGVSWQLNLSGQHVVQTIEPYLLFVGDNFGSASDAIAHYTSIFQPSSELMRVRDTSGTKETVRIAKILLKGQKFMIAESGANHAFTFSPASSFLIKCKDQTEIDYFWEKLLEGGKESQCGWLKDRFGVSWQIVPTALGAMMSDPDKEKVRKVTQAMLKMIKLDLAALEKAFNS